MANLSEKIIYTSSKHRTAAPSSVFVFSMSKRGNSRTEGDIHKHGHKAALAPKVPQLSATYIFLASFQTELLRATHGEAE